MPEDISYPRQNARTQRFSLGVPHDFTIAPDGSRIAFLRSRSGTDTNTCLWVRDTATGAERVVADPALLLGGAREELTAEERARRERVRQAGSGVTTYATDDAVTVAAFALSGRLFAADLTGGDVRELPAERPVFDPRPDPAGAHIAYVAGSSLRVIAPDGSGDRALADPEGPDVTYGQAEFVAAEEMHRRRGFWWSPDGRQLLVARVDVSPVTRLYISDPAHPDRPATEIRYPLAGTANAEVSLWLTGLDGSTRPVAWDSAAFPYLTQVHWSSRGPALLQVQTRDQQTVQVLSVAGDSASLAGKTPYGASVAVVASDTDPDWTDLVAGTPAWTAGGSLVRVVNADGAYRLMIGEEAVTPAGPDALHVAAVLDVGEDVLFSATGQDPTQVHVYTAGAGGVRQLSGPGGRHTAVRSGDTLVMSSASMDYFGLRTRVRRGGASSAGKTPYGDDLGEIVSHAETPVVNPGVTVLTVGEHALRCALLLPSGRQPGAGPALPVLLAPYGGPAAQRVVDSRNNYLDAQWFADQGFAVLMIDGRGTPGRGPDWDRLIHYHQSGPNVEDQVDGLREVAAKYPDLDTSRVAIHGWSHGGFLAALAVLRRPDVFHAAVAGAPVTDERLYDTHYTERYMGLPDEHPEAYERDSLIPDAPKLRRPLMLVHGFADDNVLVAHTLRLSSALLAAGRPHTVLPLTGITHAPRREDVAENLLLLQVDFIKRALGMQA